jgi:uncharacterized membrane-anchored protein YjiN (DUF445 family)
MKAKDLLEKHKIPCGPMSVSVEGVCRRRLRDHLDDLLDKLTQETHPEGADRDLLEMEEEPEIPEEQEPEETDDQKRERMLADGKMKIDVKRELSRYEAETANDPEEEETDDEMKKRLVKEGKLKADVKKVVQKYEDKIMPKPKEKPKPKTSDHAEAAEEVDEEQGNSKMLHRLDGKMTRWQGKG